jgi:hypothetical protein
MFSKYGILTVALVLAASSAWAVSPEEATRCYARCGTELQTESDRCIKKCEPPKPPQKAAKRPTKQDGWVDEENVSPPGSQELSCESACGEAAQRTLDRCTNRCVQ